MEEKAAATVEEQASDVAFLCLMAVQAHDAEKQLRFIETLLANLTEFRDDLIHQAASHHHPHQAL